VIIHFISATAESLAGAFPKKGLLSKENCRFKSCLVFEYETAYKERKEN
jgi:hypothetical protein